MYPPVSQLATPDRIAAEQRRMESRRTRQTAASRERQASSDHGSGLTPRQQAWAAAAAFAFVVALLLAYAVAATASVGAAKPSTAGTSGIHSTQGG
jgi:hypothetical protein